MGIEIERKFLLLNEEWKNCIGFLGGQRIVQGYLNKDKNRTVRVRTKGVCGYITVKGVTTGATRAEYEYEIPSKDAIEMLKMCDGNLIEKTRYTKFHNNDIWEIDVFEGKNEGLVVAEVELESEKKKLVLPEWIGEEVTYQPKYFNSSISNHPFKSWSKNNV